MVLVYKFKKEKLDDGMYVSRPRILVRLGTSKNSIDVPALMDSGSDITVIPRGIAEYIGLKFGGKKTKLYGYNEATDGEESLVDITFIGKAERQSVKLQDVPVIIPDTKVDDDVILGVIRIFDEFDISFKKSDNKIILKKVFRKSF
jgi:hypothetical protein